MSRSKLTVTVAGIAVLVGLVLTLSWAALFFIQKDTYTAEVVKGDFLDTDEGKTSKFIMVKPKTESWLRGIDEGTLKLRVVDSHVPYFAWAINGDRMSRLVPSQVVCMTDRGYRSMWWSEYPTAISYTDGECK